jgi:hypothetical protein
MKKSHYPLWYRLDRRDRYLIWYQTEGAEKDSDGVVLDSKGKIPVFASLGALSAYAQDQKIDLEPGEHNLHNLDIIVKWLKVKRSKREGPTSISCPEFLAAHNLFADVSRSISGNFDEDRDATNLIYGKLFWGNNLPSNTPNGKCYAPIWSKDEKRIIREIMSQGLQMFRSSIHHQHNAKS